MNVAAARLAREAADAAERADPDRPRFVAGALGPTNRTASISPDVGDPAARGVTWAELEEAYHEAAAALIEGGADILLIETIFDTLNAKAAIFAVESLFDELGERLPVIISGTIVDASGPNAVRPDGRGVLAQRPPRRPAGHRAELRARSEAAPRAPRRPLARRRPAGVGLPECRPAQRARRLRRDAGSHGRGARRVGRTRAAQHRRRVLWHDTGAHRRDRRRGGGQAATPDRAAARRDPAVGPGAGRHPAARQRLCQRRRADQRHGIAQVRQAHRRGSRGRGDRHRPRTGRRTAPRSSTSTWTRRCSTVSPR